jgi:hypothetical protein
MRLEAVTCSCVVEQGHKNIEEGCTRSQLSKLLNYPFCQSEIDHLRICLRHDNSGTVRLYTQAGI